MQFIALENENHHQPARGDQRRMQFSALENESSQQPARGEQRRMQFTALENQSSHQPAREGLQTQRCRDKNQQHRHGKQKKVQH